MNKEEKDLEVLLKANGSVDEGVKRVCYRDGDEDGFGNPLKPIRACLEPKRVYYRDEDGDGFGNLLKPIRACLEPKRVYYRDEDGDGFGNGQKEYEGNYVKGKKVSEQCWDEGGKPKKCPR